MGTPGATAFVGRADELQRLRDCAAALAGGQSAVALLEGEAGAGKTRMLEELRPTVVAGALEYARAPYAPVRDLLVALDRRFPKVLKNNSGLAEALRPVLELHPAAADGDDASQRRKLLDAVVSALKKYTALEQTVLGIEDVHWIDSASADVLLHVARNLSSIRVLLIVTYRGGDAAERDESRALVAQLTRLSRAVVPLRPLSTPDAMLLINEAASKSLPLAVRRTICELAQGSPLLLLELTRHAAQDPRALESSLPISLQALMHDRLARFDERDRDVLRVCAAMESFDPRTVAEIADIPLNAVMSTLRKARNAGIVAEDGERITFRHALMRRAITDDVLGIELSALHASIAEHLEKQPESPELRSRLAYHYWMANDTERSRIFNAAAGDQALAVYAFSDAAAAYARAIDQATLDLETFPLFCKLAAAYEAIGQFSESTAITRELVTFALAQRDYYNAAALSIELSRRSYRLLDDGAAIQGLSDAIDALKDRVSETMLFEMNAMLAWYLVHLRRVAEAKPVLMRAEASIDAGSVLARVRFYEALATLRVHGDGGANWREPVERALELAQELGPSVVVSRCGNAMSVALASNIEDFAFAESLGDRIMELSERAPEIASCDAFAGVALVRLLRGNLAGARAALESALTGAVDDPMIAFKVARAGIPIAAHIGDGYLLQRCAGTRLVDSAFASNDPVVIGPISAAVAGHLRRVGRSDEAVALLKRALSVLTSVGNNMDLLLECARSRISIPDALLENLRALATVSRTARATLHMLDALTSRGASVAQKAFEASGLFQEAGWPLYAAEALELCGRHAEALAIYRASGANAHVTRLTASKTRAAGDLTAREIEVANLVAQGKSNRSIAEDLVLSERTVENHVASIFAKLNLRSRAEIAALAARKGFATV